MSCADDWADEMHHDEALANPADLWADWGDEPPDDGPYLGDWWWRRPWPVYRESAHTQLVIRDIAQYKPPKEDAPCATKTPCEEI